MSNAAPIVDVKPVYAVTRNDKGQVVHQTPEWLHPGLVKGSGTEADFTRQVFTAESQFLAECNALYMRRDNRLQDRLRQRQPGGLDSAKTDMKALAKRHEDALKAASNFKSDPTMATAIVGIFSTMPVHEHAPAVAKLIEEGDGPTLATLAGVSSVLTRLGPEVKATIADRLYAKTDPHTFAAWNEAKGNIDRIEQAINVMVNDLAKFSKGPDVASSAEVHSVASGFSAA